MFFRDNFPGILGAIDCTHIRIVCPDVENAMLWVNRKVFYSFNFQVSKDIRLHISDFILVANEALSSQVDQVHET